jgi:hypothetical protein
VPLARALNIPLSRPTPTRLEGLLPVKFCKSFLSIYVSRNIISYSISIRYFVPHYATHAILYIEPVGIFKSYTRIYLPQLSVYQHTYSVHRYTSSRRLSDCAS